ncbi:hypothetical protein [European catfish virus]|uniref:Uncharacterized protein n=1 Tax=European catfish virus TaxID=84739 RepID=I2BFJ9_9VIRU|nr:hypothetical protein A190_gp019 [European catfish virus]AFJ52302.1 hypothetical protein [European catfish virus]AMZ04848.1 hypothetical protein [European catfish virus]AMZ04984.1 hypothetical protein [European catfish virus]
MSLLIKKTLLLERAYKKMDKPTVEASAAPVETLVLTEPSADTQAEDSVSSVLAGLTDTQAEDSVSSVLAGLTAAIGTVDRLRTAFGAE